MDGWPNGNGACCGAGFNWRVRAAAMLSRKAAWRACRRFLIAFWSGLTIAGFALALESRAAVGLSRLAVLIEAVSTLGNIGAFAVGAAAESACVKPLKFSVGATTVADCAVI